MVTTVLVAEDHDLIRGSLCRLVNYTHGFKVIAECADGSEAVRLAREHRPDILLTDIDMPIMDGLAASAQVTRVLPATRVLIVSSYADRVHLGAARQSGANGYVVKRDAAEYIGIALRFVRDGKLFISPSAEVADFEGLAEW